jgi:hypothetical protein
MMYQSRRKSVAVGRAMTSQGGAPSEAVLQPRMTRKQPMARALKR